MTRELNQSFMLPLTDTFPANRRGPDGDVAKVNCATCHQGAHKPLYGAEMAKHHPELQAKPAPMPAAAASGVTALSTDEIKPPGVPAAAGARPAAAPG